MTDAGQPPGFEAQIKGQVDLFQRWAEGGKPAARQRHISSPAVTFARRRSSYR